MINFIICEDEDILASKYEREIDRFMMSNDEEYRIHKFRGYTKEWEEFVKAARRIREEFDDWVSMIMIITAYSEYKYEALSKRLMLVDFINKLDDFEIRLREALQICMKNYDKKFKNIKYNYRNISYNIELRNILYIEKELDSKRSRIKTIHGDYYIQGSLESISKKLDKRFFKCSRSVFVNLEQVEFYNYKENILTFKNGETLNSIPREKRKEVEKRVRGLC